MDDGGLGGSIPSAARAEGPCGATAAAITPHTQQALQGLIAGAAEHTAPPTRCTFRDS